MKVPIGVKSGNVLDIRGVVLSLLTAPPGDILIKIKTR